MKFKLSLLIISKNAEGLIERTINSVKDLVDEIVVIDNSSTDKTAEITKRLGAKVFQRYEKDLGRQRKYGLEKCQSQWVLVLDTDEYLSENLRREIKDLFSKRHSLLQKFNGFFIPFQNHFLGRPIKHGGENYKMLRLFKKKAVYIEAALVHERFVIKKGQAGELEGKIYHYSYRTLGQMFKKFTFYAIHEAMQKWQKGESSSLKKIILYPLHMFWARFIEDKGYKDGLFRLPLDIGFAYMEFLTYFSLLSYELMQRGKRMYANIFKNSKIKN